MIPHRIRLWLRALLCREETERELVEELNHHLELEIEKNVRAGMSLREARRKALLDFGGVERFKEQTREARSTRSAENIMTDLRMALRRLKQSPGFSTLTVLTLALGIGATTAIFSVVSGVLLEPLPYDEPENLVYMNTYFLPESGYDFPEYAVGSPEYFDYKNANQSMEEVAAVSTESVTLTAGQGDPEVVRAGWVSPSMFTVLRTPPLLGRTLIEADGGAEPAAVTVLSYDLWQRRFGGDSTVVGTLIDLGVEIQEDPVPSEIVGVMPPGFSHPGPGIQLWAPLALDPARTDRGSHWFTMIGRLAQGVPFEEADAEVKAMMEQWAVIYPDHHVGHGLFMKPLLDHEVGDAKTTLLLLLGAVGFVLLIACANVASLLLARGEGRRREVAVRAALGAEGKRIVQDLLTESFVLALAGGVVGLLLAWVGVQALLALEPGNLPRLDGIGMDGRVLAFTAGAVLLTTLLFGLLPALQEARSDPGEALRDAGTRTTTGSRQMRFRRGIVVAEVALSVLLVIGAGLMVRSFQNLLVEDPGFNTENLLFARFSLPGAQYSPEASREFYRQLAEGVRDLSGVVEASYTSRPPLAWHDQEGRFHIEGRPAAATGPLCCVGSHIGAGSELFELMRIPLVRGRLFTEDEDRWEGAPVVVVDEAAAARYWPGEDPVGKRIRYGVANPTWIEVVGVVGSVTYDGPGIQFPTTYNPANQVPNFAARSRYLVVKTAGEPRGVVEGIRSVVRSLDPGQAIASTFTMEDLQQGTLARPRFILTLFGVFAGVALILGAIGIYGVISYGVALRAGEIGIRRALGAEEGQVLGMVLKQGLGLTAVGLVLGLAGALAGGRVLTGFLHEVSPTDPVTFVVVAGVILCVAVLAAFFPARRASGVDPLEALRVE
ncbi:MAG: ABC transporter permease [Gemmatimonadota bacterium]